MEGVWGWKVEHAWVEDGFEKLTVLPALTSLRISSARGKTDIIFTGCVLSTTTTVFCTNFTGLTGVANYRLLTGLRPETGAKLLRLRQAAAEHRLFRLICLSCHL